MMIPRVAGVTVRVARVSIPLSMLGAIAIWSCQPGPRTRSTVAPSTGRETVITDSEITRMSVRTAWDVVRMRAPRLTFAQDAQGRPTQVMIQSRRSIQSDETPLVVVDGMQVSDIGYLGTIAASEVRAIRILDSEAAEPLYGLRAAGGAIVVEMKHTR